MDIATSTELGLSPNHHEATAELELPDDSQLSVQEQREFQPPDYLISQVKLAVLKSEVAATTSSFKQNDLAGAYRNIDNVLEKLHDWETHLPASFPPVFAEGIPEDAKEMATVRSLASIYIRYHQVRCISPRKLIR